MEAWIFRIGHAATVLEAVDYLIFHPTHHGQVLSCGAEVIHTRRASEKSGMFGRQIKVRDRFVNFNYSACDHRS